MDRAEIERGQRSCPSEEVSKSGEMQKAQEFLAAQAPDAREDGMHEFLQERGRGIGRRLFLTAHPAELGTLRSQLRTSPHAHVNPFRSGCLLLTSCHSSTQRTVYGRLSRADSPAA
jgi:hypothetical protein